jgi:hypothetical protein
VPPRRLGVVIVDAVEEIVVSSATVVAAADTTVRMNNTNGMVMAKNRLNLGCVVLIL